MAGRRRAARTSTASAGLAGAIADRTRLVGVTALIATAALLAALVVPAVWRSAGTDVEASAEASSLFTLVNQARANNGLAPLDFASDLTAVAAQRASIMAESGSLTHTPDLGGQVCCWTWIGENVAFAGSVQSVNDVLMNSAPHRANILNADADDIGVAVVKSGGEYWAAEVFRARSDADRADDANSDSRGDSRGSPATTSAPSSTTGSTGTGTTTTTSTAPVLTRAELLRQQLKQDLYNARQDLQADRRKHGPFDPVKAAVRYSATLDRVTR
ncbi:MAG: CAP domain-containing protein [Actinomycetia bacterium]|nr:CAP domain-containing protein [Actinomycetes bacterium]